MTQYGDYSTIGTNLLNVLYSKIGPIDSYIIMRTSETDVGMLVYDNVTKECTEYTITRSGTSYGSYSYSLYESGGTWEYSVSNEMYVYSNVGLGVMDVLPCHQIMLCWGVTGVVCLIFLAVMFKGVLFKCLRK